MSYLVLHVRPYDFEGRNGQRVQGASVTYLDLDAPPAQGERGLAPMKVSVSSEIAKSFTAAPALYSLAFAQRRGKDGKPELHISGAKLEAGVDLAEGSLLNV